MALFHPSVASSFSHRSPTRESEILSHSLRRLGPMAFHPVGKRNKDTLSRSFRRQQQLHAVLALCILNAARKRERETMAPITSQSASYATKFHRTGLQVIMLHSKTHHHFLLLLHLFFYVILYQTLCNDQREILMIHMQL